MDLNLLIASDATFLPHAVVALTSVCENNRQHRIQVFYLHDGLDAEAMDRVHGHFSRYPAAVQFIRVDGAGLRHYRTTAQLTSPTYFRILCGEVLPAGLDRVLYLDCDVIVRSAVDEIYSADLGGAVAGAVRDAFLNETPWPARLQALTGMRVDQYFNSGVMLIDLARYRSAEIGPEVLKLLDRFHQRFTYQDQDALNIALTGRWKALPSRWNVQTHWYTRSFWEHSLTFSADRLHHHNAMLRNPGILHFTGKDKPWHDHYLHPFASEYRKYRRLTQLD